MSESIDESGGAGPSHRSAEIGVALVVALFGLIAMIGSTRVGIGWAAEGPQAGFFPFYVGLLVVASSAVNLVTVLRSGEPRTNFAQWSQLRQVLAVVIPTAVYVAVIPYLGMYVSSALLIAVFMKWLGGYRWVTALPLAVGIPAVVFVLFEIWFLVPLPKGPLETYLGY
jgi:hypothetical protein